MWPSDSLQPCRCQAMFDPEPYYGAGDDNAIYNLFATWPDNFFTSLPRPHGNRGIDEPYWELRQSSIFLDDCFRGSGTRRLFTPAIPGPDKLERQRLRREATSEDGRRTELEVHFQSALDLARQQHNSDLILRDAPKKQLQQPGATTTGSLRLLPTLPPAISQDKDEYEELGGLSDTRSDSDSLSSPIPNPPIPGNASFSIDALQAQVNEFAKANGFGVVRHNGSGSQVRKTRYVLQCDRYGEPRPSRGAGLRQNRTRKCGCKWKVIAESLKTNEYMWTLRMFADPAHSAHNHDRSLSSSAHPIHRRLTNSVKATIAATSRRVGIRACDVRGIVGEKHRGTVYTRKDVYNARALLRRDKLGGLNPTAALIRLFDERGITYIVKWSESEPNRLVGLMWTFPYCVRMWKRFPEVLSFDNTYNTNRFKLPLFQVTGQSCLKSVYNAAFGLIDNERREGFQFLAEGVRELMERHEIPSPDEIITDYDQQMKAALEDQYPNSQQQMCIHHINSNVLLNAKRRWKDTEEHIDSSSSADGVKHQAEMTCNDAEAVLAVGKNAKPLSGADSITAVQHNYRGVLDLWKFVVFAETKADYEKAWARLCGEFNDQQAVLIYLHKTYLPVSAQWAHCFIRRYRNFGIRVTSGTEASNNNVKSYLLNGTSHLFGLVEAIEDMMTDQERDFVDGCSQDEVLTSRAYSGPGSEYLGELPTVMSRTGLGLITREHRRALRSIPTRSCPWPEPIGNCGEDCTISWQQGIPCHHTIYAKLEAGACLTKWDIHPRWHLREPSRSLYCRILDPKIATSLRGRPKNAAERVPESMEIKPVHRERQVGQYAAKASKTIGRTAKDEAILGPGKQIGLRQAGYKRPPSLRRRRSEWEIANDDKVPPSPKPKRRSLCKPVLARPSAPPKTGSRRGSQDCIHVQV